MKEKNYAKLRGRTIEKGMSQKDVAKQIGMSETTYSFFYTKSLEKLNNKEKRRRT